MLLFISALALYSGKYRPEGCIIAVCLGYGGIEPQFFLKAVQPGMLSMHTIVHYSEYNNILNLIQIKSMLDMLILFGFIGEWFRYIYSTFKICVLIGVFCCFVCCSDTWPLAYLWSVLCVVNKQTTNRMFAQLG